MLDQQFCPRCSKLLAHAQFDTYDGWKIKLHCSHCGCYERVEIIRSNLARNQEYIGNPLRQVLEYSKQA